MVRIKICGITNEGDARAAIENGANALGFIFIRESPRYINPEHAAEIIRMFPPFISAVGVFANEKPDVIEAVASQCGLHYLQLHGEESPDFCSRLKLPVIKAFRMVDDFDERILLGYGVRGFLFDTALPGRMGGTGIAFDWKRAVPLKKYGPLILAGGLNPDNVSAAIRIVQPYAVDVSSGIEQSPGRKDHAKMKEFINRCRES